MGHAVFFTESCAGGESVATLHMNHFFASTHQCCAKGWTGHKYQFSSLWCDLTGNQTWFTNCGGTFSTNGTT